VENVTPEGASDPVAVLTQEYTITNNGASPIDFEFLRAFDGGLLWSGDFTNDNVALGICELDGILRRLECMLQARSSTCYQYCKD